MEKLLTDLFIQNVNMSVVLGCLIVGYVIKNSKLLNMVDNRNIPLILIVAGVGVSVAINKNISYDIIISGAVSGMVSTGLHQAFHQTIKKYIERFTEMPIDPELLKGNVAEGEETEDNSIESDGIENKGETEETPQEKPQEVPGKTAPQDKPVTIDEVFTALKERQ